MPDFDPQRTMTKRESIAIMSVEEAMSKIARGESRSVFAAADRLGDDDLKRQAADDPEEGD